MNRHLGSAACLSVLAGVLFVSPGLPAQESRYATVEITLDELIRDALLLNPLVEEARIDWLISHRSLEAAKGCGEAE